MKLRLLGVVMLAMAGMSNDIAAQGWPPTPPNLTPPSPQSAPAERPNPLLQSSARGSVDLALAAESLRISYPDAIIGADATSLTFRDGLRMPISSTPKTGDFEAWLDRAGLADQFLQPYPLNQRARVPGPNEDPGRARHEAFFLKLYGDCKAGAVDADLVIVPWLPKSLGSSVRFNRSHGAAAALARVSQALDVLPARFLPFLKPTGGTFNCRKVAGTTRASMHSYGVSIDLAVDQSNYWRWEKPGADGKRAWRNRFPIEIVEIFERNGFVWGGRWYHFDTMHFEYRPELIHYTKAVLAQSGGMPPPGSGLRNQIGDEPDEVPAPPPSGLSPSTVPFVNPLAQMPASGPMPPRE